MCIKPEHERRRHMDQYAELQKFKLWFVLVLAALVWLANGCPLP